ncbi:SseB family protein [Rathayibacter toxicus]|uniref:SseB family protein n=1 Tax=Rathayibacter toxicus TaxID=145458 RepID=UPI000CE870D1|nr:SseB family protein [Rathayibacter toxicus]PPI55561.1 hypothetical protein C5D35_04325 [Rathayibacter toxicus]QOD09765.1 SseB family protein [Rathayibacter toxicus]
MSPPRDDRALSAHLTDSAGTPWAGRRFEPNSASADDGSAPVTLVRALAEFASGAAGAEQVVDVLRECRLLIPLVTRLAAEGEGTSRLVSDTTQELAVVTVAGPDGRAVLPIFSSVDALRRWDASARPIPIDARRAALAAVAEATEVMVLDPASEHEFVVRRPALWAIAEATPWRSSVRDSEVAAALQAGAWREPAVASVAVRAGDERQRLTGPELVVVVELRPGLDRDALDALVARLGERWAASAVIAARVDSMTVQLVAARDV